MTRYAPDLIIYTGMRNAGAYAEVLLRSLALYGGSSRYRLEMSILVGDSHDDTLLVCETLAPHLPFPCRVRSFHDLSISAQTEINEIVALNDGYFNECVWDWLVKEDSMDSTYYAGIHVDLFFNRFGLWDSLLDSVTNGKVDVAGLFSPGELVLDHGVVCMTPPRILPVVVLCQRERASALGISWSRPCSTKGRTDRLIVDNGTLAIEALMGTRGNSLGATFLPLDRQYLEGFVEHFGFLWTQNHQSSLHPEDGNSSRRLVNDRLRCLRSSVKKPDVLCSVEAVAKNWTVSNPLVEGDPSI